MNKAILKAAALAMTLTAGSASAAILSIDGGSYGEIPGPSGPSGGTPENDVINGATWGGYYGANASVSEGTWLKFEFIGFEAGYANQFFVDGVEAFNTEDHGSDNVGDVDNPIGSTYYAEVGGGLIPFLFSTNSGLGSVDNTGLNPDGSEDDGNTPNFFLSFSSSSNQQSDATEGNGLYVFLDDGGAGEDDNHDDMVVRITEVPEPGMLALLGAGLVGLGFAGRRRKA